LGPDEKRSWKLPILFLCSLGEVIFAEENDGQRPKALEALAYGMDIQKTI
jgi:hypothetical protein